MAPKGRIRAKIRWLRGKKSILSTTVTMKKGIPAILGGPAHKGGALIITLEVKP